MVAISIALQCSRNVKRAELCAQRRARARMRAVLRRWLANANATVTATSASATSASASASAVSSAVALHRFLRGRSGPARTARTFSRRSRAQRPQKLADRRPPVPLPPRFHVPALPLGQRHAHGIGQPARTARVRCNVAGRMLTLAHAESTLNVIVSEL